MTHENIETHYISKPVMGVVQALPKIRDLTIEVDEREENGCCGTNDTYREKLHDLGLRPNQIYYVVNSEFQRDIVSRTQNRSRNNWSAIWSSKRLREHHRYKAECKKCPDNFGKYAKKSYRTCAACRHGLNVTESFIINPDYFAYFINEKTSDEN